MEHLLRFWFLRYGPFLVFIDFATKLLLFSVLVFWLQSMWDLSSQTRDGTHTLCTGR